MKPIKHLPQNVVVRIAAGQVVDRPESVVKELIENALDAKASFIDIQIEKSGMQKIKVKDDGFGMSPENLSKSFLPHTTSKINKEADLDAISSLGFRGEALAAIAHVAELAIKSKRRKDKFGYAYTIKDSKVTDKRPVGMDSGTIVEVTSLFSSFPGRKQKMKNSKLEFSKILDTTTNFAVSYPSVAFRLRHNGKQILDLRCENMSERVYSLFRTPVKRSFVPIKYDDGNIRIVGFLGTPQLAKLDTRFQYLSVNSRPVMNQKIRKLIKLGYGRSIDPRTTPFSIIYIQLHPSFIDANIHPRKTEIAFINENQIIKILKKQIQKSLQNLKPIYKYDYDNIDFDRSTASVLKDAPTWDMREINSINVSNLFILDKNFIVYKSKNGLLLVDQHAAHERILYNSYLAFYKESGFEKNLNKVNLEITLPAGQSVKLKTKIRHLNKLGIKIKNIDNDTYLISAIPEIFQKRDIKNLIDDFVFSTTGRFDLITDKTITYLACRTAIKKGDFLTPTQAKLLIKKLLKEKNNATCPHGRPTMIEMNIDHFNKIFKR